MVTPIVALVVARTFIAMFEERLGYQFGERTGWVPLTLGVRLYLWREVMWPYVERYWLWGLGTYRGGWVTEENYYMFLILKAGIFSLAAYAAVSWAMVRRLYRDFRRSMGWARILSLVLVIHLAQILVANMTGSYFEYTGVSEMVWFLLGLLISRGMQAPEHVRESGAGAFRTATS
jgi:hypothetical protein